MPGINIKERNKMLKSKKNEQIILSIFILSIIGYLFIGFKCYTGVQYASILERILFIIFFVNIILGLIYLVYRFIDWVILLKRIKSKKRPSREN